MIETKALTKSYRRVTAIRDVSFTATPGRVTGLVGLNGSGKSTTLRILLGLSRATSGAALINGKRYHQLRHPLRQVGAVLEQGLAHPGQTGYTHLVTQALLSGTSRSRVKELLSFVGLDGAAAKRTGDYSLGMRQRLSVATALLGEPDVLILDEAANGLDPSGMAWLRELLREHAARGGTVLISSHLLSELEQVADDVVVIGRGEILHAGPLAGLIGGTRLRVRGGNPQLLWQAFERYGGTVTTDGQVLYVSGLTAEHAGDIALHVQVPVYELVTETPHLEDVFLSLAGES
ncbi:ABC-2 type transport system ATP-binding protein [Actinoplanes octamycinicus]|uniref:ABC-2 type transport system ATP-binding protein n=1 Tax=Actinoplanes octamycinicus TaxID=135948 RepID=A0A7W7H3P6_9ACTN|nr:ATP-binding cassette domain-containing protein [Actinoplanes octamycinicus]MBB4743077.1 ABC-2 type transport system ATP-binding protein [Actinoplanes octamycinicus]GIE61361.1 ABC transporter ATP-binding protein [Actinoplanes octamycinicus]